MNIGFIVGKDDEVYDDDFLYSVTPKKYLQYENLHTDVAICMVIKQSYPDVNVDIILPYKPNPTSSIHKYRYN